MSQWLHKRFNSISFQLAQSLEADISERLYEEIDDFLTSISTISNNAPEMQVKYLSKR